MADNQHQHDIAKVDQIKHWSPIWIVPIVTLLIGSWILFYQFSHQGPEVTLITENAEGLEAGKTTIKSLSVDVGIVESVVLTNDLHRVEIKARLNDGMEKLLYKDSAFWVVKPHIGLEGITGLGTLLSGAYIELQPGIKGAQPDYYQLLDAPPLAPLDAKGIRIILDSKKAGQLNAGDPVLFRGYCVGTVETSTFDTNKRTMTYQLFISAPYDHLVTTNVRFWKDSGIAVDMSASGMRVEMASLTTMFSGGVSFDVPEGTDLGQVAENKAEYHLFDNQRSIQSALYTNHLDFLLFFSDSIRGLQRGAPVEFRGIRLGTVAQVPYIIPGINQALNTDYRVPVLIRIEPDRFTSRISSSNFNFEQYLQDGKKRGLRATLKTGNLISGSLYVDLDFYNNAPEYKGPNEIGDLEVIPTVRGDLSQIQQKLMAALDKINSLPVNQMINKATNTLQQLKKTLDNLNQITGSTAMKMLPEDIQQTLRELNRSMKGLQPGSPTYNKLLGSMQRFDQVLRELQPLLKTLNTKSNALIFEAKINQDLQPKRAKQ